MASYLVLATFWGIWASENSAYRPWLWLLLSLAGSAAWLLSSRQDVGLGATTGAVCGQALALFFLLAMIAKAAFNGWWIPAVVSVLALFGEMWLVKRWYFSRASKSFHEKAG